MRKLLKFLALLGVAAIPTLAFGQTLNPQGEDAAWPLYVMGNGEAIYEILTAIKLLVLSPAFKSLLLFVATVGTVITGVAAGFNPGQNVIKFFSFFISVWMVIFISNQLKSDVAILDKVNNYNNVVTGVPAIVAVPASVISQTGHWMTTKIEQNFSIPSSMQMSGNKSSGTFALSAKMVADSGKMVITNAPLKANIANYVGDCLVPALARNNISLQELMTSTDFWKTAQFNHKGILTKYVPISESPTPVTSITNWKGELKSCEEAYAAITTDLENYGSELMTGSSAAWSSAGVMVPLENMFGDTMNWISGSTGANPAGMIKQRVILNSLSGAFRSAATQTGNNEMLTNIAVSTAEESQRSGWAASAAIFNNMMGYVFSTLQALIFAIVPLIIVAALIPGFGKTIFVNYGQIMLWLALWEPMLAVVNFLIAVFAKNAMGGVLGSGDTMGFTFHNNFVMTQEANNLVIASQFLGTMVPMITWGLVKGAMAFTEFISHGIGANLGAQAGKEMATGNVGLNNAQFDNFSANKFNSTSQSSLGFGDVNSSLHAGHGGTVHNAGGPSATQYGGSASASMAIGRKQENSSTAGKTDAITDAAQATKGFENSTTISKSAGLQNSGGDTTANGTANTVAQNANEAHSAGKGSSTGENKDHSFQVEATHSQQESLAGTAVANMKGPPGGPSASSGGPSSKGKSTGGPVGAALGAQSTLTRGDSNSVNEGAGDKESAANATNESKSAGGGTTATQAKNFTDMKTASRTGTNGVSTGTGSALKDGNGITHSAQTSLSATDNNSISNSAVYNASIPTVADPNLLNNMEATQIPEALPIGSRIGGAVTSELAEASHQLQVQTGITAKEAARISGLAQGLANRGVSDTTGVGEAFKRIEGLEQGYLLNNNTEHSRITGGADAFINQIDRNLDKTLPVDMTRAQHGLGQSELGHPYAFGGMAIGAGVMNAIETFTAIRSLGPAAQAVTAAEASTAVASSSSVLTGGGITTAGATGATGLGVFGMGMLATAGLGYLAVNDNHETNTVVANGINGMGQSIANFLGMKNNFGSRNMPETN